MIQLKLLTGRVGNGFSQVRGDVVEFEDMAEADRMCRAGQASPEGEDARKELAAYRAKAAKAASADAEDSAEAAGEGDAPPPARTRTRKK